LSIAILQPTPFRKGHYFVYTNSLFNEIKYLGYKVKILSAIKTYAFLDKEKSNLNFNIYSVRGLIIYLFLCFLTVIRFIYFRKQFKKLIILDCEYTCVSILLILLKFLNWEGKIILQINAPNFDYDLSKEGFNIFRILKLVQSYVFRKSLSYSKVNISCLGEWHKNQLTKQLSIDKNRIFIIEDGGGGIIKEIPKLNIIKKLKKESINYPKDKKKIFLLFGNIRRDKGHLFLKYFWDQYFNSPEDPLLWIVGHDEEKLTKRILFKSNPNVVLHNSYVPFELISYIYQISDYAILPYLSNYRGGSGPLMKGAFTHSKLAIVANVSEMGRLAKQENLAEYFQPENESSLLSCLERILKNNDEYYIDKIKFANKYANDRNWPNLTRKFLKTIN
tara:strand:- start:70 stop:1239 length:1170 start_codon:yes stop_codon:yes gene_type:complete